MYSSHEPIPLSAEGSFTDDRKYLNKTHKVDKQKQSLYKIIKFETSEPHYRYLNILKSDFSF
jgi:hypothetical protein